MVKCCKMSETNIKKILFITKNHYNNVIFTMNSILHCFQNSPGASIQYTLYAFSISLFASLPFKAMVFVYQPTKD